MWRKQIYCKLGFIYWNMTAATLADSEIFIINYEDHTQDQQIAMLLSCVSVTLWTPQTFHSKVAS